MELIIFIGAIVMAGIILKVILRNYKPQEIGAKDIFSLPAIPTENVENAVAGIGTVATVGAVAGAVVVGVALIPFVGGTVLALAGMATGK